MDMQRELGREVLVVIGMGAMGLATARRLGAGRELVLADVDESLLKTVKGSLTNDGHRVSTKKIDVTSRGSIAAVANFASTRGRLAKVVHTAGVGPEQGSIATVLSVNLFGTALVLEEFAKVIAPGGSGVVIASMAGHLTPPFDPDLAHQLATTPANQLLALDACRPGRFASSQEAYPFTKQANLIRVAAAAQQWGDRGARINSISPGIVSTVQGRTELAGPSGDTMRAMIAASAMQRMGTPDDIAAAADFLLSPAAGFSTGTDLLVDGGVTAALRFTASRNLIQQR